MPKAYADVLVANLGAISNKDTSWVQFVKDHRSLILQNTKTVKISAAVMFQNKYRMDALLTELGIDTSLGWIIAWLNQFRSNTDIANLTELIVPDIAHIQDLLAKYKSFAAKRAAS